MYIKKSLIILIIIVFVLSLVSNSKAIYAQEAVAPVKDLKVLIIEINPYLKSKKMKVTDYFNTFGLNLSLKSSVKSIQGDFVMGSNGVVNCKIVGVEYLNEFPTYTKKITLSHIDKSGKEIITGKDYKLDETTYLDIFRNGWNGWWDNVNTARLEGIDNPYYFDYNYILNKYNLVERKNAKEFDMVWVFSIDMVSMRETSMVGRSAFDVNGATIYADCDNFVIAGFNFTRSDSAFECIGHYAEAMLNNVYQVSDEAYNKQLSFTSYNELNTWQKFYLCLNKAPVNVKEYGVGQVHFAPNSTSDYDWENQTPVISTWIDWKNNYPKLTGETAEFTANTYFKEGMTANQAHKRWWFSLMPHHQGRDANGYSHNWWDYILSLDYVTSIGTSNKYFEKNAMDKYKKTILLETGDIITDLKFTLNYKSGKSKDFIVNKKYNYVTSSNNKVISIIDGKIKALATGSALIKLKYDGRENYYKITVVKEKKACLINVNKNK